MASGYPNDDGPPWVEMVPEPDRPRRQHLLGYVVVAVIAAGLAVAVTLLATGSSPSASSSGNGAPSVGTLPSPNGGLNNGAPQGGGSLFIIGTVSAISRTSITISGPQGQVAAAIAASTRITGSAHSAADIKVGDRVSAQIAQSGGKSTATSIQDPARIP